MESIRLLTYLGEIADYEGRGVAGARLLGAAIGRRLGVEPVFVGGGVGGGFEPDREYHKELETARSSLMELQGAHRRMLDAGRPSVVVLPRCAGGLATLPNLAGSDAVVVWFDAHADFNTPASTTTGYIGGMILSAALGWWDAGFGNGLSADQIVLGGARDLDSFEESLIEDGVVHCVGGDSMLEDLDNFVGDRPVFFHLDCDVLEPGIVPVEFEVEDGLTLDDLRAVAQRLARNRVVGMEIAEFEAPAVDDEIDGSGNGLLDALEPLLRLV